MLVTELTEIKSKLIGDESVAGSQDNPKEKKFTKAGNLKL